MAKSETGKILPQNWDLNEELETKLTPKEGIPQKNIGDSLVYIYPPGPKLGERYILKGPIITIGRENDNNIFIDNDTVSRKHSKIIRKNSQYIISDLNSTNGTYVNHHQIKQHTLHNGDLIKIGRIIFKFLSGNDVENAYHEEIYKLTITDGLTGAFNKRYLMETLEKELARAKRYSRSLSILLIDLDHFKKINDSYGHLMGDKILREICNLFIKRIRREETLTRYGGEEFIILLPETDKNGAITLAEQLRKMIEEHKFVIDDMEINITISIGVGIFEGKEVTPENLIKEADKNLYKAKNSGRNKVIA